MSLTDNNGTISVSYECGCLFVSELNKRMFTQRRCGEHAAIFDHQHNFVDGRKMPKPPTGTNLMYGEYLNIFEDKEVDTDWVEQHHAEAKLMIENYRSQ